METSHSWTQIKAAAMCCLPKRRWPRVDEVQYRLGVIPTETGGCFARSRNA